MENSLTPIAIFAYNRPDKSAKLLDSLAKCSRLDECKIFIFCDGPKNESDRPGTAENLRVVRAWADKHGATVEEREINLGLAKSIFIGTTQLCNEYGRAIVLEDDLVVSPHFVSYMLDALARYEHDKKVFQISGYNFPIDYTSPQNSYFLPMTTSWGWATWKNKWEYFSWDIDELVKYLSNAENKISFDLDGAYSYSSIVSSIQAGRADSWGIRWYWQVYRREGLVLYPNKSLIWVGGLDDSGRHHRKADNIVRAGADDYFDENSIPVESWPIEIQIDQAAFSLIKEHMRKHKPLLVNRGDRPISDFWYRTLGLLGRATRNLRKPQSR